MKEYEERWWDRFGQMIGAVWTKESASAMNKHDREKKAPRDKIFIPLAQGIRPEIWDIVKKSFAHMPAEDEFEPKAGEEVVDMGAVDKEDFMAIAKQVKNISKSISKAPASKGDNEKLDKMKQQLDRARSATDQIKRK